MKFFTFLTFLLASCCTAIYAQNGAIGIGTENPNPKSILDVYSTDKGLLIPRLTVAQRDALQANGATNAAVNGLLIYNTSSSKFNVWNLDKWEELSTTAGIKGDPGEKGDPGVAGPQGLQGPQGDRGAVGATGAQGPRGDVGLTGMNGAVWSNGNLNPPVSASEPSGAKNGDYYLNNNNGKVFIRNNGVWQEVANLTTGIVGPVGPAGAQWYNGALNPPSNANEPSGAKEGDLYLNNTSGDVFKKTASGTWTSIANLTTGIVGPQGPQGNIGPQGPQGDPGVAGPQGAIGPVGPVGATGLTGAVGPQGAIGATGPQGPQGNVGPQGPQGIPGVAGPQGSIGPIGATGATGAAGPQGVVGATGATGPQGAVGAAGPQGPQGIPGVAGPQGPIGPIGATGATGAAGPQGLVGATGATGPQGAVGAAGPQGATGPAGAVGPAGAQGPIGLTGPAGIQGAPGPQGLQGDPGEQGPVGPAGPSGTAASWMRTGNGAGFTGGTTNPGVNNDFVGTTDAKELVIASNRTEGLRIATDGKVRVGIAGSYITSISKVSVVADLPSIATKGSYKHNFTVTGVGVNASVAVSSSVELPDGLIIAYARVVSANTVEVKFINLSDLAINLPSATFHISAIQ